jgi:hypothetical protein
MPWKGVTSENVAFVMPWKGVTSENVAFVMPWKGLTSGDVAFVMPWKGLTSGDVAYVMPWKESAVPNCDTELGADFEKMAMLPLGTETGRHIRIGDQRSLESDADRDQAHKPVAQVVEYLGANYAMLPLGAETGRHVRNLNEDNKQPEKTVVTNVARTTA